MSLTSALTACADRKTSAPGNGEPEARLRFASRILAPSLSNPLRRPVAIRKRHFPLYQIIWPGNDGLYPWDTHAQKPFKQWQPLLGRP